MVLMNCFACRKQTMLSFLAFLIGILAVVVDGAAVGLTEKKLYGVNYSMRQGPDWDEFKCQSPEQAKAALVNLQSVTNNIRIFSVTDCDATAILLGITQELNMGIWLGLWVAEDGLYFDQERNRLLQLLQSSAVSFDNVLGIHVSSEAIYRKEITAAQAISYRNIIKQDFIDNNYPDIPVVVVDIVDNVIDMPQLIYAEENVVMFNQFPIWNRAKANINTAAEYMDEEISTVETLAQGRQIIVGETGWADAGSNQNANLASPSSYAKFLRDWICLANERNWQYFWFDAYDSDWRRIQDNLPNDVEGHFGLFNEDGQLKDYLQELLIDCSKPRTDIDPTQPTTPRPNTYTTSPQTSAPVASTPRPTTIIPTSAPSVPIENEASVTPSPTTARPKTPAPTKAEPTSPSPSTKSPTSSTVTPPPVSTTPDNQNTTSANTTICQGFSECDALGLIGACCPTQDEWTLDCCGPRYEPTCENNTACAALGLEGACCPTSDGVYLDCCQSVPNDCFEPGSCTRASAVEYSSKCELHSACQDLVGECCPTADGIMLECCGVPVQEQCQANDKCIEFGLEGACCPTVENIYLDCCESLPNECKNETDSCEIMSALEYSQRQKSQASFVTINILTVWILSIAYLIVPVTESCFR